MFEHYLGKSPTIPNMLCVDFTLVQKLPLLNGAIEHTKHTIFKAIQRDYFIFNDVKWFSPYLSLTHIVIVWAFGSVRAWLWLEPVKWPKSVKFIKNEKWRATKSGNIYSFNVNYVALYYSILLSLFVFQDT